MLEITADQANHTVQYSPGYLSIRRKDVGDGLVKYVFASAGAMEGVGEKPNPCSLIIEDTENGESLELDSVGYYELDIPNGDGVTKYETDDIKPVDMIDQYLTSAPSWSATDID